MGTIRITVALADQGFRTTKSLGILNLSAGLTRALAHHSAVERLSVLGSREWEARLGGVPVDSLTLYEYPTSGRLGRLCWDQVGLARAARRAGNPWLLLPKGFAPWLRPRGNRVAVYVHDVMADFYARHYPEAVSGWEQRYFIRSFQATLRHADVIVTNTAFTRAEVLRIAEREGVRVPAVEVVGIGFDEPKEPVRPPTERPPEILVLASRLPHKRTGLMVDFVHRWGRECGFDGVVHWVGELPDGVRLPETAGHRRHPRLEESAFQALLRNVRVVVYASENEGFGMPPVEAVLAGACPVYSRLPATEEVMQGLGCPFDTDDYASFADTMRRAMTMSASDIDRVRQELCLRFRWESVAERTVAALQRAESAGGADPAPHPSRATVAALDTPAAGTQIPGTPRAPPPGAALPPGRK
jgi:glycosyltransferase involved in cell wall biosynthesis